MTPTREYNLAMWRFARAVRRVRTAEPIIADYATSICGRPVRRREVAPLESAVQLPGVTWTIDGDVVVEFLPSDDRTAHRMLVYEIGLVRPLRKAIRTRHIEIEYRH